MNCLSWAAARSYSVAAARAASKDMLLLSSGLLARVSKRAAILRIVAGSVMRPLRTSSYAWVRISTLDIFVGGVCVPAVEAACAFAGAGGCCSAAACSTLSGSGFAFTGCAWAIVAAALLGAGLTGWGPAAGFIPAPA